MFRRMSLVARLLYINGDVYPTSLVGFSIFSLTSSSRPSFSCHLDSVNKFPLSLL